MDSDITIKRIEIKYDRLEMTGRENLDGWRHIKSLPWLSVVQSVEGSYEISINGFPAECTGNGGFFIAPSQVKQNILHHADPITKKMQNRWIFLDVVINGKYRLEHIYDFPTIVPDAEKKTLNDLFNELFSKNDICDRMSVYYQIVKLLMKLAVPKEKKIQDTILPVIEYMYENYKRPIGIAELSNVAHMSESNLYVCFKKQFGRPPIAYLNHYRLTLASDMLKQTELSIGEISESVGFPDQLYFSRLFKREFKVSPRQYRNSY